MPAIITDQFRILNAETFINSFVGVGTTANYYYTFLGHPNPKQVDVPGYTDIDWNEVVPEPRDSFEQENSYHDSMLFLKKITSNDVTRVIPRYDWQSGSTYDMYRNDYNIDKPSNQLNAKTLYESKFIVVNSEYKVYMCLNNGSDPNNLNGKKSLVEPNFVSSTPQAASNTATDDYLWQYLFTISPADIIKFATENYIPVPKSWVPESTVVSGSVKSIVIKDSGSGYQLNQGNGGTVITVPILGDGTGGKATLTIVGDKVSAAEISDGGSGYTKAFLRFASTEISDFITDVNGATIPTGTDTVKLTGGTGASFEIPIPPKGGHTYDIYRDVGAYRVMVFSKYDSDPDWVVGNSFSRIGIVKNPTTYTSKTERINKSTLTNLAALKFTKESSIEYEVNKQITQTLDNGDTAVGVVASWNKTTGVLKYFQPVGISSQTNSGYKLAQFDGTASNKTINQTGVASPGVVDSNFNADFQEIGGKRYEFGQSFSNGVALPEVGKYSGDIIYVDNRASIVRSTAQKEEVKIVVEF